MNPQAARARGARPWSLALLAFAALAALGLLLATSGGGAAGKLGASGRVSTGSLAMFRAAIIHRVRAQHLNYQWVACVPSGRRFQDVRVVRCNVDFGIDPHVEAYCAVLRGGRLVTDKDDPAIPCGPDNAGRRPKLITYG